MSIQQRGRRATLLMAFEDSYGQMPVSAAAVKLPYISNALKATQPDIEEDVIVDSRNPLPSGRGLIDPSGAIAVPMDQIAFGYWLTALLGAPTTTGASAPYTHVWTLGDNVKSMAIEKGYLDLNPAKFFQYLGCKISRMGLEWNMGNQNLNATVDIMGSSETIANATMDESPASLSFVRYYIEHMSVSIGATAVTNFRNVSLNIDADLDGDSGYTIGSGATRTELPEGIAKATGSIKTLFRDVDLATKAANGEELSLKFAFVNGTNSIEFLLPQVRFERNSPEVTGPKGIELDLNYRAYLNGSAEGTALKVTMKNSHAAYLPIAS